MSTELTIAIAVVVAVVVVVAFLKIRASFKKADVAEDFIIAPETTSEHTITVDESQAAVQASEPISVVADAATTEVTEEAAPAVEAAPTVEEAPAPVEEVPAPVEESAPAETSTIKEALDVVVTQITPEEPKTVEPAAETVTETVTEEPKPTKAKKASTKKTTKKSTKKTDKKADKKTEKKPSKKDANLANFIDTISKSSEKKTRGRKKKTDDVKIIVTAPLGKSKASKKKKKA